MRPRRALDHGQYGYARRERCKCEPCRTVVRTYAKRRQYDADRGAVRRVDVAPVRRHVQRLLDGGFTWYQIAGATDGKVTAQQVKNLILGRRDGGEVTWVYPHTFEALLAVTPQQAREGASILIDAAGVHRRIQALRWMGYPLATIAEHLGVTYAGVHRYLHQPEVRTDTAEAVKRVYDRLAMTPGPSERERWIAYRRGWVPPMAWDEQSIDDPDAEPDLSLVVCIVGTCHRPVHQMSLCRLHHTHVRKRGALAKAQRFRAVVTSWGEVA